MQDQDLPKKDLPPNWEKRTSLGIVSQMREVLLKAKEATEAELELYRKKLKKATEGG